MRSVIDLDIDYWETELCGSIADVYVHTDPDQDKALHATVAEYGGCIGTTGNSDCGQEGQPPLIKYAGSNVAFTNGVEDPWQWATERDGNPNLNQMSWMADCENCAHCADLYTPLDTDADELNAVRQKVMEFLAEILGKDAEQPEVEFLQ